VAVFLPFQWTFYFPINALVGQLSPMELLAGLGAQVLWILVGIGLISIVWRYGIRRFSAVGN
jgi:ABC-2 type transport system permease protein